MHIRSISWIESRRNSALLQFAVAKVRYIEYRVCIRACERERKRTRTRTRVRSAPPRASPSLRAFRHWKAATPPPSAEFGALEQMYRGGFLACHRTDDYAMPRPAGGAVETQLQRTRTSRQRGGWSGDHWVPEQARVRECAFWKKQACSEASPAATLVELCLFAQGPHCCTRGSFHACHDFPSVHQSPALRFAFVAGKAFWDPPP